METEYPVAKANSTEFENGVIVAVVFLAISTAIIPMRFIIIKDTSMFNCFSELRDGLVICHSFK